MCGIIGYLGKQQKKKEFQNAMEAMAHRGPDNQTVVHFENSPHSLTFGHLRLSIIDLSSDADQPMYDTESRYCLIFNGEIYNFRQLKKEHLSSVAFQTGSDTEVLLEMYRKYNKEMLQYLEGMFALAIYDSQEGTLFIARDQLGIKPMYLYHTEDTFIFSSEIKGICQFSEVDSSKDKGCLAEFLVNGFLYEPDTGYQNVTKLKPGHYAFIDINTSAIAVNQIAYWELSKDLSQSNNLEKDVSYAINSHLVSDAKKGLFFSGGVDSSLILCMSEEPLEAMTVRPDDEEVAQSGMENDFSYAKRIAAHRNVDLIQVPLDDSEDSILSEIEWIAKNVEEPIADYTFLASYKLSQKARDRGYKVMLSGMGADELFGGYDRYLLVKYAAAFRMLLLPVSIFGRFWKSLAKKTQRFASFFREKDFLMKYSSLIGYFSREEISFLLGSESGMIEFQKKLSQRMENCEKMTPLKKAMFLDAQGFLSHNFMVADKSSMLASIEMRVPLATHSLYARTMNASEEQLIRGKTTKRILKSILEKFIPKELIYRKKTGFNPPLDAKIWNLGMEKIMNTIQKSSIIEVINMDAVQAILEAHFTKKVNNTYKIYSLLFLAAWYNQGGADIKRN